MTMLIFLPSTSTSTNIRKYDAINVYHYSWTPLVITYSIATFLALVLLILGIVAMLSNGVTHDGRVSTIIATMQTSDVSLETQWRYSKRYVLDTN